MQALANGVSLNFLKTLHALCTNAGVHYVILGGAACWALGNERVTEDVDIVASTGKESGEDIDSKIDALVRLSGGHFSKYTDEYGVPHYFLDGVEVEIFDPAAWPNRPQYSEFLSEHGSVYIGDANGGFRVVSPPLLLREKLITFGERRKRAEPDFQDIRFWFSYCRHIKLSINLGVDDDVSASAQKGLSDYVDMGGEKYAEVVLDWPYAL